MSDAIFTWASGTEFCQCEGFQAFLKSLENVDGAIVVFFTHDMPQEVQDSIKSKGYCVHQVNPHEVTYPIGDRHIHYWRYLCDADYDYVLHVDCRDVVFQSDPFWWVNERNTFIMPKVVLVDEGMPPSANGFHLIEQFEFQKGVPKRDPRQHPILNGGTILGTTNEMKSLFLAIWSSHIRLSPRVTDQAALNYLYHFLKEDPAYCISNPTEESFCLTGEGLKDNFVHADFRDGIFYHKKTGEPYSIVHQWDRSRYAKQILAHYS